MCRLGAVTLAVAFQELGDAVDGLTQIILMWQEHNAEMVRLLPVKAGTLDQHDTCFAQQLQEELPVIRDRIDLGVQLGKHVQRRTGLDTTHTRNRGNQLVGQIALASQVPFPGRELTALVSKIATDSAAGIAAFAVAAAMYVATGLLIAWAGATLEKKVRILR